ncbi:MAG: two-component regulator propeller domain-containing protein, partial [Pseudomonadota bacterium]
MRKVYHSTPFISLFVLLFSFFSTSNAQVTQSPEPCVPAWNRFAGATQISSSILSSIKGPDNLIYLGGRDGLYRIEGGDVHSWLPDFTDPNALPAGQIKSLSATDGYIWVGTSSGVARLDLDTGVFDRNDAINQSSDYAAVNATLVSDAFLYVGTENGGHVVSMGASVDEMSIIQSSSEMGEVHDLTKHGDVVLAASSNGLWRFEGNAKPTLIGFMGYDIRAIARDQTGGLWMITPDSVISMKTGAADKWIEHKRERLKGLPSGMLTSLAIDRSNRLWIGSPTGLSRWTLSEPQPVVCRRSIDGSDRDQNISIAHLSGELGNYIFLGSRGRAASYAPLAPSVRRVLPGIATNPGLPEHAIWSTFIDNRERFYAGTSNGLYVEKRAQSGEFEAIADEVLGGHRIYSMTQSNNGNVWIGTSKGLFVFDSLKNLKPIRVLKTVEGDPVLPAVFALKPWKDRLLAATSAGLIVFDPISAKPTHFFRTNEKIETFEATVTAKLPISRVWSIDPMDNEVFLAGHQGAVKVDMASGQILASSLASETAGGQPIGHVYNVLALEDGRIFLGTEAGLVETDYDFSSFKSTKEINGLRLRAVMSSGRDSDGNIWIGVANNGLFRYSLSSNQWTHLTQSKGLVTNGVSQLGLSFSSDGRMAVSNATGASIVDLKRLKLTPELDFDIKAIDGPRNHILEKGDSYQIGPNERDLRLSFLVSDLIEPNRFSVEYSLSPKGRNPSMAETRLEGVLSLINLAPGSYDFRARVRSTSGATSEPFSFDLIVKPFWWESRWFYGLIVLMTLLLLILVYGWRARSLQARYKLIDNERKRIAQELHDTSLQDLFGAKMVNRMLVTANVEGQVSEKANRVMSLLDTAIESLRASVETLSELSHVPPLSESVRSLNPSTLMEDQAELMIDETGKPWHIQSQRRFFVMRVIQEAVNNACKHSNSKRILVKMTWSFRGLSIKIEDDGIGFDQAAKDLNVTYGLRSMARMANAAKSKLEYETKVGIGTNILLSVPRFVILVIESYV